MRSKPGVLAIFVLALASADFAQGQPQVQASPEAAGPKFDAALAARVGADEYGMRNYVLVVLKTGPNEMPAGKERDEMFPEFHKYYGSAALMLVDDAHERVQKKSF